MAAVLFKLLSFPPPLAKSPTCISSPFIAAVPPRKFGSLMCGTPVGRAAMARGSSVVTMVASNVVIAPEENEPEDSLIRRFRSKVLRAGVIQESKRRRFFENKQEERKRKTREAAKKNSFRRRRPLKKNQALDKQDASKKKKVMDEEEDNWEVPEILPY